MILADAFVYKCKLPVLAGVRDDHVSAVNVRRLVDLLPIPELDSRSSEISAGRDQVTCGFYKFPPPVHLWDESAGGSDESGSQWGVDEADGSVVLSYVSDAIELTREEKVRRGELKTCEKF